MVKRNFFCRIENNFFGKCFCIHGPNTFLISFGIMKPCAKQAASSGQSLGLVIDLWGSDFYLFNTLFGVLPQFSQVHMLEINNVDI